MTAKLIDGKAFAAGLRERVKGGADALMSGHGVKPGPIPTTSGDDLPPVVGSCGNEPFDA